eukprot:SAG31_NODE_43923_length_265_cov_0.620482_1_plen_58_part_01
MKQRIASIVLLAATPPYRVVLTHPIVLPAVQAVSRPLRVLHSLLHALLAQLGHTLVQR